MLTYTAKQTLKHDGKSYADGDRIELSEAEAQALIDVGVIGQAMEPAAKPAHADELHAIIRATVEDALDANDPELWTKSGKAKTEAIEAVLGYAITAAERDTAMAAA